MAKYHPSVGHVMQYFTYAHLPSALQALSKPFCELAEKMAAELPSNPETTFCLRQLLLAKDAAVRASLGAPTGQ